MLASSLAFWTFFLASAAEGPKFPLGGRGLDIYPVFSCWNVQNSLTAAVDWTFILLFHAGMSRISSCQRCCWTSLLLFHDGMSRISSQRRGCWTFILLFHDEMSIFLLLRSLFGHFSLLPAAKGPEFPHGGGGLDLSPAFS